MALCTQADVEKKLQWDITAEPDAVITSLIADAQAMIEGEMGRALESGSHIDTFNGREWSVFLTHWPVTAVATVVEDGVTLTVDDDYRWYTSGKLVRVSGTSQIYWPSYLPASLVVTYTGGYTAGSKELEHLGSICAEVVARAFRKGAANAAIPAGATGAIQSVSLEGSDSVTYASESGGTATIAAGGLNQFVYLEADEIRQLHLPHYTRPRFGFA